MSTGVMEKSAVHMEGRAPHRAIARTPRVLQVVLSLTPGGTEHLVVEICRRLAPEFGVAVCCLDNEGEWAVDLQARGVEVNALRRRPGFRPQVGRAIAQFAREYADQNERDHAAFAAAVASGRLIARTDV